VTCALRTGNDSAPIVSEEECSEDRTQQEWFQETAYVPRKTIIAIDTATIGLCFDSGSLRQAHTLAFSLMDSLTDRDEVAVVVPDYVNQYPCLGTLFVFFSPLPSPVRLLSSSTYLFFWFSSSPSSLRL